MRVATSIVKGESIPDHERMTENLEMTASKTFLSRYEKRKHSMPVGGTHTGYPSIALEQSRP